MARCLLPAWGNLTWSYLQSNSHAGFMTPVAAKDIHRVLRDCLPGQSLLPDTTDPVPHSLYNLLNFGHTHIRLKTCGTNPYSTNFSSVRSNLSYEVLIFCNELPNRSKAFKADFGVSLLWSVGVNMSGKMQKCDAPNAESLSMFKTFRMIFKLW